MLAVSDGGSGGRRVGDGAVFEVDLGTAEAGDLIGDGQTELGLPRVGDAATDGVRAGGW
jgi:hypothetical protein